MKPQNALDLLAAGLFPGIRVKFLTKIPAKTVASEPKPHDIEAETICKIASGGNTGLCVKEVPGCEPSHQFQIPLNELEMGVTFEICS